MGLESHQHLGQIQGFVVGARLRAPLLRSDRDHLGEDLEAKAHFAQHILTFLQRDGSRHLHQHIGIAFIKLWQKFRTQPLAGDTGCNQHSDEDNQHGEALFGVAQYLANPALIAVMCLVKNLGLFHHHMLGLEQQRTQRRHQPHGKDQRPQQGKAVGHGQWSEDAAFNALQRENRNQRRNHNRHGKQRGLGHCNG